MPPTVVPNPATADEAGQILRNHLDTLFPNPVHAATLLDWMAWIVQNRGQRMMWCPVIQGVQGCGKSVIQNVLAQCLGKSNVALMDKSRTERGWTGNMQNVCLVVFDEIVADAPGTMSKLKEFITGEDLQLNRRNKQEKDVPRCFNVMITLNDLSTMRVAPGERRFCILQAAQQHEHQVQSSEYFDRLFRLKGDLAGGIFHFLLTWRISDAFLPNGRAPVTPGLKLITTSGTVNSDVILTAMLKVARRVASTTRYIQKSDFVKAISDDLGTTPAWTVIEPRLVSTGLIYAIDDAEVLMSVGNMYQDTAANIYRPC